MSINRLNMTKTVLFCVSLVTAVGCRNTEVDVDVMPGRYPNLLTGSETTLDVALIAPPGTTVSTHDVARAKSVHVVASTTFAQGAPVVSADGVPRLRDVNGDGQLDLIASFSVAELRAAGIIGRGTTRLAVRASVADGAYCEGWDRLFDVGSLVLQLPPVSGPDPVGTTNLLVFDGSRPGLTAAGRGLVVRLWYPAASASEQPTSYFLDQREAVANLPSGLPVTLPSTLYDGVHAWSQRDVQPKGAGKHPALLLSTGYGVPLTFYSGLAEDLAGHGYVVVGVEHPDGSGVVVYPDGRQSTLDPTVPPTDATVHGWARDLEFVLARLSAASFRQGLEPAAREAVSLIDIGRVGALGHSLGGAAAIWADAESPVIRASANLDGALWGDVLTAGPNTPTMLMLAQGHFGNDPTLDQFLAHAKSRVYRVEVAGAQHDNFSDLGTLADGLVALVPGFDRAMLGLGSIESARALTIQSAYLRAFFHTVLQGGTSDLLQGPSPDFPEVTLTRQ